MSEINKYSCEDCKWNIFCEASDINEKCKEFELDKILSDVYINSIIKKNKIKYKIEWHENYCEYNEINGRN